MATHMSMYPRLGFPDFQSYAGPGDRDLPMSEIEGFQPVSRIGEIVQNAYINWNEFGHLSDSLSAYQMVGPRMGVSANDQATRVEHKPMYHEWATVTPGMICLHRKKGTMYTAQYGSDNSVPCIACAACLPLAQENQMQFAGVARTKQIRPPDDGAGPTADEYFTVALGGLVTVLNNSGTNIHLGDHIEWCFVSNTAQVGTEKTAKRLRSSPRRIAIQPCAASSSKLIGVAKHFSQPGESLDILLKQ